MARNFAEIAFTTAVKDMQEKLVIVFIWQLLEKIIIRIYNTVEAPKDFKSAGCKVSRMYYNKTLSNIINERIIIEAKRELYLTNKAVKEIAYELGFEDEYYFSRLFKVNADISPQKYRKTVVM